jgi:transposase
MAAEGLWMSIEERERLHLVHQAQEKQLSQRQASERLGIGIRQFKRLVRSWKQHGDAGLVSRQRGRASNNRLAPGERARIAALLRDQYPDFGPTLAVEKLLERDGIVVSAETVRQMQIAMGLWRPKRRRHKRVFQLRERRPRFGELIQIDGSPHAWLEDRGPRCTLIVFIDDATSRLTALHFAPSETTRASLTALRSHVLAHGRPLAFYSDRHGIFRVNAKEAASGDGKTEFGRVAERLAIESIHARTPQAKGRVERSNQTPAFAGVGSCRTGWSRRCGCGASQSLPPGLTRGMAEAEAYLPVFMAAWNQKFAVDPRDDASAHRPWTGSAADLDAMLARREERVLSKALTFRAGGSMYCVKTSGPGTALRGARVTLLHYMDGSMRVHYKDRILACTAYRTLPVVSDAEDEKTIDARVDRLVAAAAKVSVASMVIATI